MKKWIFIGLLLSQVSWAGNSINEIAQRCAPVTPQEMPLYSGDFKWGYDLPSMLMKFTEVYKSPKRLPRRAFWDSDKRILKLPYENSRGGDIEITETFVQTITRHVERAFELKYVNAVFFPDMGHSHLLVPQSLMENKYDNYPNSDMSGMYREMFRDSEIGFLYHTAEQLQTLNENGGVLQDEKIRWRHKTRNIVGRNSLNAEVHVLQNPASKANTVNAVSGFYWWGAGFNLSAQKDGCFEFQAGGKKYYFDLSMYDLEPDPDSYWNGDY